MGARAPRQAATVLHTYAWKVAVLGAGTPGCGRSVEAQRALTAVQTSS
jgi:hypothetical protein